MGSSIQLFCRNAVLCIYLTSVYLLTAYSMVQLVQFLSWPPQYPTATVKGDNRLQTALDLFYDLGLLSVFLIVHTLIPKLNGLFKRFNIDTVFRATYVALTNFAILVLINYWKPVSNLCWSIDLEDAFKWKVLIALHILLWFCVYGTALIFDINELIGMKQIYNKMLYLSNPMDYKSPQLCAMYAHLRHPNFSAISLILLTYPLMTMDRFLICSVFIPYMYFSWKVTEEDYKYTRDNLLRKKEI